MKLLKCIGRIFSIGVAGILLSLITVRADETSFFDLLQACDKWTPEEKDKLLLHIFNQMEMSPSDYQSVSETCKLFNKVAKDERLKITRPVRFSSFQWRHFPAHAKQVTDLHLDTTYLEEFAHHRRTLLEYPGDIIEWLRWCFLGHHLISDRHLKHLEGLKNLRKLSLSHVDAWGQRQCKITDEGLDYLKDLENLEELDLSNTTITSQGLHYISHLKKLRVLILGHPEVTFDSLSGLSGLENLETLILHSTKVTNNALASLAHLPNLKTLCLANIGLNDSNLECFPFPSSLERLDLSSNEITDEGARALESLTNLKSLKLSGNKITNNGMPHLSGLAALEYLDLGGNSLTDKGIQYLADLVNLKGLRLAFNRAINGKGVEHLGNLIELQLLDLSYTKFKDEKLPLLTPFKSLLRLDLGHTKVKSKIKIVECLEQLPKLENVELLCAQVKYHKRKEIEKRFCKPIEKRTPLFF